MTVNPYRKEGYYDVDYLASLPAEYEDKYIRYIHFDKALVIKIDGRTNRGIILKPGIKQVILKPEN